MSTQRTIPPKVTGFFMRSPLDFALWTWATMEYSAWSLHVTGPSLILASVIMDSLRRAMLLANEFKRARMIFFSMAAVAMPCPPPPRQTKGFSYPQRSESWTDFNRTVEIERPSMQSTMSPLHLIRRTHKSTMTNFQHHFNKPEYIYIYRRRDSSVV